MFDSLIAAPCSRPLPDRPAPGPGHSLVADLACRALRAELAAFPKPGLVSLTDSGSHRDMHAGHFLASITALGPFFAQVFHLGRRGCGFDDLRRAGIAAEKSMLRATNGVNTHRGAIFCLGLLAAAAGRLAAHGHPLDTPTLTKTVARQWGDDVLASFASGPNSNGLAAWRSLGMGGARAEAASGFPSVVTAGAPALNEALAAGADPNDARVHAFFAILATAEDTTLAHRGGAEGVAWAVRRARAFHHAGGVLAPGWRPKALDLHREFVKRNLSAGGAADLLSATLFCRLMEETPW